VGTAAVLLRHSALLPCCSDTVHWQLYLRQGGGGGGWVRLGALAASQRGSGALLLLGV
jgi:hypothetical protein